MASLIQPPLHIRVSDFGVVPGSLGDATLAVNRAIDAAHGRTAVVEFAPGDYHFYRDHAFDRELYLSNTQVENPRKISILLENQNGLSLEGHGARLIFHDRTIPFALLNSNDVKLNGFTVDWDRPMMSQGTVVESGPTGFALSIDARAFPYEVEDGQLYFVDHTWKRRVWAFMEFDPSTKGVRESTGDAGFTDGPWSEAAVHEIGPGKVRFDYHCKRFPKVGDLLVARHGVRDHAGTFIDGCRNVTLSDIRYRFTSGLGILSQYSENLTFRRVEVAPDPASGRVFAGHDDGFHFSNCKGSILVEDARFEGLMDDPINVHGTAVRVIEKLGPKTLKCRFMHDESVGMRFADPGDSISLIDHETMLSRGTERVRGVKHVSAREFEIEVEKPLPEDLAPNDAVENLTWTPSFTVRNTTFGRVRARGLLVSTPGKVLVEGCTFRSSGAAILIAGDANYWFESGAVRDVTIRKNVFENCNTSPYQDGDAVISIHPEIPKPGRTTFHENIRIENNTFRMFDAPVLWAKSVKGLCFLHNRIQATKDFAATRSTQAGLTFVDCQDVHVEMNHLDRGFSGNSIRIETGNGNPAVVKPWK